MEFLKVILICLLTILPTVLGQTTSGIATVVVTEEDVSDLQTEVTGTYSLGTQAPDTDAPGTDAPRTEAPGTDAPGTEGSRTESQRTDAPGTESGNTEAPGTQNSGTEASETEGQNTEAPGTENAETDAPGTDDSATEGPGTGDPETEAPGTGDPGTDAPGTGDPETDAPGTGDPETEAPTEESQTDAPTTEEPVETEAVNLTVSTALVTYPDDKMITVGGGALVTISAQVDYINGTIDVIDDMVVIIYAANANYGEVSNGIVVDIEAFNLTIGDSATFEKLNATLLLSNVLCTVFTHVCLRVEPASNALWHIDASGSTDRSCDMISCTDSGTTLVASGLLMALCLFLTRLSSDHGD